MEDHIFCDGIGRIAIIGGVVRLDLFTFSPTETDANGNPRPVLSHRIVMGTEGFVRSSEKVVEAVQAITRARPPQAPPQPSQAQAPRPSQATPATPPAASAPASKTPEPPPPSRLPFP